MPLDASSLLLNPRTYDPQLDEESRRILLATVEHLEGYGLDPEAPNPVLDAYEIDKAGYDDQYVRSQTGIGAASASSH